MQYNATWGVIGMDKWISVVQLFVLIFSAYLTIRQLKLLRRQIEEQHEERRRENTTHFMATWCNSVKKDTCIAEQVARKLNTTQCKMLYDHAAFEVSEDIKKDICKFCPLSHQDKCSECSLSKSNIVDGKILTELRWHVITYLNTLETILVSWHLGIVDQEMVEEEFAFINDPEKGCTLAEFRHTAGGYPIIEEFIDAIKEPAPKAKKKL